MSAATGEDRTAALVEQLAADLQPAPPIAPIRRMLGVVFAAGFVVTAAGLTIYGLREGFVEVFMGDLTYASVLLGLVLAVSGACTAALASVIPGRENVVRAGASTAALGAAAAIAVVFSQVPWSSARFDDPLMQLACIARGVSFAALPAVALLALAARGWSGRPGWTVGLLLFGAGATGALVVHLTCSASAPLHVLLTHLSTPLLLTALLTLALAPVMRRLAR